MRNRSDRPSAGGLPRAVAPTVAPPSLPLVICALALCALAASPGVASAAPAAPGADAATVKLDVAPDGDGTVTVDPTPAGAAPCAGSPDKLQHCTYAYDQGQEVTLTAQPSTGITFVGWSDARCAATGPCTLRTDADWQSVTALFSPHRITVAFAGAGTVTTPDGSVCETKTVTGRRPYFDCGLFPVMSQVTLRANPSTPEVFTTWDGSVCDPPAPEPGDLLCTVSVYGVTRAAVGFDDEPGGDFGPSINVHFRVLKQGSGSGTVRGESLDCGRLCALEGHFGDRETLVADPAPGSTFTGWRGMCSTAARCSLAVGPVTTVIAVFDQVDPSKGGSSTPAPDPSAHRRPSPASAPFVARLQRTAVTGHGRRRSVLMRVQVNTPATVRAVLRRGRRPVTGGRWRVDAGTPLLRLRVPAWTPPGRYRIALSLRDAAGHATHLGRRVWLPR